MSPAALHSSPTSKALASAAVGEAGGIRIYRGEEPTGLTLPGFAEQWYIPHRLEAKNPPASPLTIAELRTALRQWIALTGDPPLAEITPATCEAFATALRARSGRGGQPLSADTVYKRCADLQLVLQHAGPAGPHCKRPAEQDGMLGEDAAGRPRSAPWFPELKRGRKLPKICLSLAEIERLIVAAKNARQPLLDCCPAGQWWAALYRFLTWTGLRIGSARAARRQWIHRERKLAWAEIPGKFYKGGSPEFLWICPGALAALESLPDLGGESSIFSWPHTFKHLESVHKLNLRAAGILPLSDYGLHTFRRAIGSALYELCPPAAALLLRHAGGVTVQHYVQTVSRVRGQEAVLAPLMRKIAKKHPGL